MITWKLRETSLFQHMSISMEYVGSLLVLAAVSHASLCHGLLIALALLSVVHLTLVHHPAGTITTYINFVDSNTYIATIAIMQPGASCSLVTY